jgi:hypothetical protein
MTMTLSARVGKLCQELATEIDAPDTARSVVEGLGEGLREPLRVAVAGRVNAGKSTLVNALLRQRVAPTDVSECTRLVTWYRYGVPERVEVVTAAGRIDAMPLRADGTLPSSLGIDLQEVAHLVVYVSSDALLNMVIIDTPGLSSLTDDRSQATRELLAIDQASRLAAAKADALVLVMTGTMHSDEAEAVIGFRNQFAGLAPTALNAVGVLNKADLLDLAGDPLTAAKALSRKYAEALRSSIAAVVPLIGLHAETADCGLMSERVASLLRVLADMPDAPRQALLLSVDRFVTAAAPVESDDRALLLERLDMYGIERSFEWIRDGRSTANAITNELRSSSGIEQLRHVLDETFARNADALKAASALATLERLAFEHQARPWSTGVRDQIEDIRLEPEMHRLAEVRALQEWASGSVVLPTELALSLQRLFTEVEPTARLGLAHDARTAEIEREAASAATIWRAFGNDARATPPQHWLADVACRSCELMWSRAHDGAQGHG